MTCGEVNGLLDRLMDGELTEEERRAMEAHGRECPECAEAIRATMRMKALFDEMEPEADVPLAAQAKWRGAVREAARQKNRARLIRWIGSAAAAVVVLAGVGLAMNLRGAPARDTQNAEAQIVEISEAGEADEAAESAADPAMEEPGAATPDSAGEAPAKAQTESAGEAPANAQTDSAGEVSLKAAPDSAYEAEPDGAFEAEPTRSMAVEDAAEAAPVMEFAAESAPMSAGAAGETGGSAPVADAAEEDLSDADGAVLETDGETSNVCAALAQRAPACEVRLRAEDTNKALAMIFDLASEYEADPDLQFLDDGGMNVYVEIPSGEAGAFLKAIESVGTPEGEAKLPDEGEGETVLLLVALLPEE